jgi:hypothetical protein
MRSLRLTYDKDFRLLMDKLVTITDKSARLVTDDR